MRQLFTYLQDDELTTIINWEGRPHSFAMARSLRDTLNERNNDPAVVYIVAKVRNT